MVKKMVALLLMITMLVQTGISVSADEMPNLAYPTGGISPLVCEKTEIITPRRNFSARVSGYAANTAEDINEILYERICEAIKNRQSQAIIDDLRIPTSDFDNVVSKQYHRAALALPQYLPITKCGCTYYTNTGLIYSVLCNYMIDDDSTYKQYADEMQKSVDYYVNLANSIPDTDIVGKMLVIHDAFVNENVYATDELSIFSKKGKNENEDYVIFTAYGALVNKRAVCQGNTLALNMIYEELNERLKAKLGTDNDLIGTGICLSDAINHIWNCVRVDGEWYFIDETWNDPISEKNDGGGTHNFFLSSADWFENGELANIGSHGKASEWEIYSINVSEPVECTSKKYESGYIFNSKSEYTDQENITHNAGTYFGTIGYSAGKYTIDMTGYFIDGRLTKYSNMKNRYVSSGIKSYGILLGENYYNNENNVIECFVTEDIDEPIYGITADFDGNRMTDVHKTELTDFSKKSGNISLMVLDEGMIGKKMMLWSEPAKPVSEARTIE